MKNTIFSLFIILPLFAMLRSAPMSPESTLPAEYLPPCTQTTGAWTISFDQINPFPCGTVTVTASYNNGDCPAPGDIVITKTTGSQPSMSPNPLVGSIPSGSNYFVVGYLTFSQYTAGDEIIKLKITVTGGHTITNPIIVTNVATCL